MLHGRIRLARDGCLVDCRVALQHTPVHHDFFTGMRRDHVARADFLHRHLPLHAAFHAPYETLIQGQQP